MRQRRDASEATGELQGCADDVCRNDRKLKSGSDRFVVYRGVLRG
jgi:hypothetical protein